MTEPGDRGNVLWLEHEGLRVEIAPEQGAALLSLQSLQGGQWCDWLIDSTLASSISTPPCFLLLPFANRIEEGELAFFDDALNANRPDISDHPIHGYAWQAPWHVERQSADSVELSYDGRNDPWPWPYRASLAYTLGPEELCIRMTLTHLGPGLMPAGLGLHPAFPSDDLLAIRAETRAFLPVDDKCLPAAYVPDAAECAALAAGNLPEPGMDSDFDGWQHRLHMEWQDRVLTLSSDPVFAGLHVFKPQDGALVCLEPVTHLTGAMARKRLPEVTSPQMLGTDQILQGSIVFHLMHR